MAADNPTQGSLWETGEPLKRCRKCGQRKPYGEFYKRSDGTGLISWCKVCRSTYTHTRRKIYMAQDPEVARRYRENSNSARRNRAYGVSRDEYLAMRVAQGDVCAICKKPETYRSPHNKNGTANRLSVDHSHSTGKVRGLLCNKCNALIGMAGDDPAILRAAIAYLETHQEPPKS